MLALLGRHAAVAGRRRGADLARAAAERLLRRRRQRAEAHAGDRDRDLQLERLLREARAERDVGVAALAVALERVARDARAEEEQVVEVRHAPLGAEAADVVDALARRALDLRDHVAVEEVRLAQVPVGAVLISSPRVVDVEVVEPPRRAVAAELAPGRRRRCRPARAARAARSTCSSRSSFSTQSAPSPATSPRT